MFVYLNALQTHTKKHSTPNTKSNLEVRTHRFQNDTFIGTCENYCTYQKQKVVLLQILLKNFVRDTHKMVIIIQICLRINPEPIYTQSLNRSKESTTFQPWVSRKLAPNPKPY